MIDAVLWILLACFIGVLVALLRAPSEDIGKLMDRLANEGRERMDMELRSWSKGGPP